MQRQKTENASSAFATAPTRGASYAQIAPDKSTTPKIGSLHKQLVRDTCQITYYVFSNSLISGFRHAFIVAPDPATARATFRKVFAFIPTTPQIGTYHSSALHAAPHTYHARHKP